MYSKNVNQLKDLQIHLKLIEKKLIIVKLKNM